MIESGEMQMRIKEFDDDRKRQQAMQTG